MDVLAGQMFSASLPLQVGAVPAGLPAIEPAGWGGGLPLSFAQQRLWLLEQPGGPGPGHPVSWRCRLRGELDREALRRALERIVARHDALRTTFRRVDGEPEPRVAPVEESGFRLLEHDLSGYAEPGAEAELGRVAAGEADAPFSLEQGPLVRGSLIRLGARDHVLLVSLHPLVSDAGSLGVFAHELGVLYAAFLRGEADPLPALPVQYADYAAWQRRLVDGGLLRQQAEYWQETLADAPEPLELPADRPRPAQPDHAGALVRLALDKEVTAALRALGSRHGATLSTTLLAGWAAVLGRLSGQADLVIGTSTGSRGCREVEGLIGCFVNPLPVRVDLSGSPTAAELLGRVEARVQEALRNQDLPFQRVVELVQPDGAAPSATPLFRAAFAWRDPPGRGLELPGLQIDAAAVEPRRAAGLDLSLELREEGGGVAGEVVFATALFERETVERYTGYLRRVLAGMAADEARRVDRLTLLSGEERRRVVEEWNRTEAPYPGESYIHERFKAQAGRTPDAVAVVFEDRRLTYGELNRRANRLAHHLRDLGVGPDVRVGICVDRSPELVISVLGVLKAGGAYLPLDPGYPQERLLDMVRDSAPVVVVTQGALAERLAGLDLPLLALDEDAAWWGRQPATDPERGALTPEHLTYVIYTSGSTGRPKGVEMTHRGASNLLHWYLGATRISERDSVLIVTSFSFHLTQRNLLAPLFVGGRVHLAREPFEPLRIASQIARSGITMMNLTPTGFQALVEADRGQAIGGLRIVVFGGEPLYPRQLARVPEPRPRFLNPYGATEATGITTHHFARADLASYPGRSMPPGRPIANARIYVLDGAGEPVPVGVTGELYLGGVGVTRGYRRLPGQTAERFLPDPFGATPGARLYRTGDLGRWLPDGTIEFIGRGDAQVKVRGFRVELGEIEARLAEHTAVHEVVVVARDGEVGDPRLVAYYTGDQAGAAALRAHLAERLPEYMIPAAFVFMDALPVNPNGKLDRRALPVPELGSGGPAAAPRTPTEEILAGIWSAVLGVRRVGVDESFFDLGGHSLLATRITLQARKTFGVDVPLHVLLESDTVSGLARWIDAQGPGGAAEGPPIRRVARGRGIPLSPLQEYAFVRQMMEPDRKPDVSAYAARLLGPLNARALAWSFGEVVRRHESLRTTFAAPDGKPEQVVCEPPSRALPRVDLTRLPAAAGNRALQRLVREESTRPFDARRPPVRPRLVRLGPEEHVLVLVLHHIVTDDWSRTIMERELAALYSAFLAGRPSPLPELEVQYADYVVWLREEMREETQRQLAYWRDRLRNARGVDLSGGAAGSAPSAAGMRTVELEGERLRRLRRVGQEEGCTAFMVLLAAYETLLFRYTGQDDITVLTPLSGRTRPEVEGVVGFFAREGPLRTDLSGNPTFRELLHRMRDTVMGAYANQDVAVLERVGPGVAQELKAYRSLGNVRVRYDHVSESALALEGLEVEPLVKDGGPPSEVTYEGFRVLDLVETVRCIFVFRANALPHTVVEEAVEQFEVLLDGVLADPGLRIGAVPLQGEDGVPVRPVPA